MGNNTDQLPSREGPTWWHLVATIPAWLFAAAMFLALALGLLTTFISWRFNRPPFSLELLKQLDGSMSIEDVRQVLGSPTDWWVITEGDGATYQEWVYSRPGSWPLVYIYFTPEGKFSESVYDH